VPVFAGYPAALMGELLRFSDVELLVTDQPDKVLALDPACLPRHLLVLAEPRPYDPSAYLAGGGRIDRIGAVLAREPDAASLARVERELRAVAAGQTCMIMYTSGTSGFPKGVQLTHHNLLSQQQALAQCWQPQPGLRMLCYLPWHHSFGGLFERFFAVAFGGCLALDDGGGRDVDTARELRRDSPTPQRAQDLPRRSPRAQANAESSARSSIELVCSPPRHHCRSALRKYSAPMACRWSKVGPDRNLALLHADTVRLDRTPGVVGLPIPASKWRSPPTADSGARRQRHARLLPQPRRPPPPSPTAAGSRPATSASSAPRACTVRARNMFKLSNGEKVFPAQIERIRRASS
jgi:hypothetical protein